MVYGAHAVGSRVAAGTARMLISCYANACWARDSSSWLVNVEKCVTDYFDGAMCAAEALRGPRLVALMEETSHAAGCCREPPSAPPARAEEPNLDTPSRAPPAGMVRTASCRATPRWIHGVPLHTRSAAKLSR